LGASFEFQSDHAALLKLVDAAFAGLPRHRLPGSTPLLRVFLRLHTASTLGNAVTPPPLEFHSGGGLICATADAGNYVVVVPEQRSALVVISRDMLRFPYHARYELLEFAVCTLATRCQGLVPLHAACVAQRGQGILLIGNSGTGKSTLALCSMLAGLQLLSEDAVFIEPASLAMTAVPTFLHLQPESLRFLGAKRAAGNAAKSPLITRRSGIAKLEIDLRQPPWRISPKAVQLVATVFLSKKTAAGEPHPTRLKRTTAMKQLNHTQAFARTSPNWLQLSRKVAALPAFELCRGQHPGHSAAALTQLFKALRE
jgi:energy-coupling factor transporter ATP-binding protein EcfA2